MPDAVRARNRSAVVFLISLAVFVPALVIPRADDGQSMRIMMLTVSFAATVCSAVWILVRGDEARRLKRLHCRPGRTRTMDHRRCAVGMVSSAQPGVGQTRRIASQRCRSHADSSRRRNWRGGFARWDSRRRGLPSAGGKRADYRSGRLDGAQSGYPKTKRTSVSRGASRAAATRQGTSRRRSQPSVSTRQRCTKIGPPSAALYRAVLFCRPAGGDGRGVADSEGHGVGGVNRRFAGQSTAAKFTGQRQHVIVPNAGHNPPQEIQSHLQTRCGSSRQRAADNSCAE